MLGGWFLASRPIHADRLPIVASLVIEPDNTEGIELCVSVGADWVEVDTLANNVWRQRRVERQVTMGLKTSAWQTTSSRLVGPNLKITARCGPGAFFRGQSDANWGWSIH